MLVNILSLIHNTTTLLFGVYASAAFLGIRMNRKNILALLTFSCITGVFYVLSFVLHGTSFTEQVYPFIIHIPLVLFLTFYYKYKMANSILAVLTAYLCCQISNWTGIDQSGMDLLQCPYLCDHYRIYPACPLRFRYYCTASAEAGSFTGYPWIYAFCLLHL